MTRPVAAAIALGLAIVLAIAWSGRSGEGRRALAECEAALVRGDAIDAILAARVAAEARCPTCSAPDEALAKLEQIAKNAEARGDDVTAFAAWRAERAALIAASGVPIAAPSANLFSRPSPTTAAAVLEDLAGRIDAVLDGGETQIGVESTVLSLIGAPTLLRPGGVLLEEIEALIGEVLLPNETVLSERVAQPAPGMLLKHYSPRAKLLLVAYGAHLERRVKSAARGVRGRLGLLLPSDSLAWLSGVSAERFDLGATHQQIASRLFAGMRALDAAGCDAILTHQLEGTGLGRALNDRLFRAASGNVIQG